MKEGREKQNDRFLMHDQAWVIGAALLTSGVWLTCRSSWSRRASTSGRDRIRGIYVRGCRSSSLLDSVLACQRLLGNDELSPAP